MAVIWQRIDNSPKPQARAPHELALLCKCRRWAIIRVSYHPPRQQKSGDIVNDHLSYLRGHERAAVSECVDRLRQTLGEQLIGAWLFGSKARGDFAPDSDIDLLIVIPELDWSLWDEIRLTAARVSLEYDVLLNTHILDQPRWRTQERYRDTLWREVQQDGVSLL